MSDSVKRVHEFLTDVRDDLLHRINDVNELLESIDGIEKQSGSLVDEGNQLKEKKPYYTGNYSFGGIDMSIDTINLIRDGAMNYIIKNAKVMK